MLNQLREYDVILGGQNSCTAAVLGGLEGVKQPLASDNPDKYSILIDALQYGAKGKALVKQYFNHPDHSRFFIDMVKAGCTPTISERRFSWYGPGVNCDSKKQLQKVIRATKVDLVWDSCGKEGAVAYPAAYSRSKLRSIWLLLQDRENPEAIGLRQGISICLYQAEPLCTLAQNLLSQLKDFSFFLDG